MDFWNTYLCGVLVERQYFYDADHQVENQISMFAIQLCRVMSRNLLISFGAEYSVGAIELVAQHIFLIESG